MSNCALFKICRHCGPMGAKKSDGATQRKKKGATWSFAMVVIIVYRFRSGFPLFLIDITISPATLMSSFSAVSFFLLGLILFHFILKDETETCNCMLIQPYKWCLFIMKSHLVRFDFQFVHYIHVLFQERLLLFNVKFVFNIHLSNSDTQTHTHTNEENYFLWLTNYFWTEWMNIWGIQKIVIFCGK